MIAPDPPEPKPYALAPGAGEALWMFDSLDTIKAGVAETAGNFSVIESLEFEGSGPPLHVHDREDRGFYVLEGDFTFFIADQAYPAPTGTWIFAPRHLPHTWRCNSARGRTLVLMVPGGMDAFFREAGDSVTDRDELPQRSEPDVAQLSEIAARHGLTITGPPPGPP